MNHYEPPMTLTLYVTNRKLDGAFSIIKIKHQPTDRETRDYDQVLRFARPGVMVWVLLIGVALPIRVLQHFAACAVDQPALWIPWDLDKMTIGDKQL